MNASLSSSWESLSFVCFDISPKNSLKSIVPSLFASTSAIISFSSASVGVCPSERITTPSSLVVIVPSPSESNSANASLYSFSCKHPGYTSVSAPACGRVHQDARDGTASQGRARRLPRCASFASFVWGGIQPRATRRVQGCSTSQRRRKENHVYMLRGCGDLHATRRWARGVSPRFLKVGSLFTIGCSRTWADVNCCASDMVICTDKRGSFPNETIKPREKHASPNSKF